MKLIVGLGNPGREYRDSRHNVGFLVVDALARAHRIVLKKEWAAPYFVGRGKIAREEVILIKPLTYMNLSGQAIKRALKKYKTVLTDVLVVCDDLDLEFGRMKIRSSGSSGGHRGLQSIIDSLENQDFNRLRIGIGRPRKNMDPAEYVLLAFCSQEMEELKVTLGNAVDCLECWLKYGIAKCMNVFNRKEA